jgi:hypothetical protein
LPFKDHGRAVIGKGDIFIIWHIRPIFNQKSKSNGKG